MAEATKYYMYQIVPYLMQFKGAQEFTSWISASLTVCSGLLSSTRWQRGLRGLLRSESLYRLSGHRSLLYLMCRVKKSASVWRISLSSGMSLLNSILYSESLLNHLNASMLDLRDDEALVVNCQNWLRYLPDDQKGRAQNVSLRDTFLEVIKGLNPRILVVVDEDADLGASSLTSRITTCFNYFWIPFDALETFLPKDNHQRIEYEADIGHKIEDIITYEGLQRIERLESGPKLSQRMKSSGFLSIPFCEETVREVKFLLDEHASGWGMKREEDMLVLTWKGHNSIFATAWFPSKERNCTYLLCMRQKLSLCFWKSESNPLALISLNHTSYCSNSPSPPYSFPTSNNLLNTGKFGFE
ncbi:unnamed protein product, partial [Vitis vinifera]